MLMGPQGSLCCCFLHTHTIKEIPKQRNSACNECRDIKIQIRNIADFPKDISCRPAKKRTKSPTPSPFPSNKLCRLNQNNSMNIAKLPRKKAEISVYFPCVNHWSSTRHKNVWFFSCTITYIITYISGYLVLNNENRYLSRQIQTPLPFYLQLFNNFSIQVNENMATIMSSSRVSKRM